MISFEQLGPECSNCQQSFALESSNNVSNTVVYNLKPELV